MIVLSLAAVLASVLAWEAVDASRSHEAVARASLREQATFAATNFASEARDEVLFDLLDEGVEVVEETLGWDSRRGQDRARFERMAREERWPFADHTAFFFRRDLPGANDAVRGDELLVGGTAPDALLRWVESEIAMFVARGALERDLHVSFAPDGTEVLAWDVSSGRGRDAIHGLVLSGDAISDAFDEAFREEPLLPEALTAGLSNDEIFLARALGPDGRTLYASSDAAASEIAIEYPLGPEFGGMRLELLILEDALDVLVAGGVPASRLPFVLALLTLTALLLGAAVWQLRREAELARLRTDFVSGVSHQLLTPLTQIRMFGETLLHGRMRSEEEKERAAEIIIDEADRLTHQVANLLMFSRGEAGTAGVSPIETDISGLLGEVIEGYLPLAQAEGVSIRTEIEPEVSGAVDPETLRQAVLNLLDNAVKYGGPGKVVEVGATMNLSEVNSTIWVEDEGPGVPKRDRERIWDAFVRLDEHRQGPAGGSGIGLAVVRRSVEALGGRVRVEDRGRPGAKGARFLIELPRAADRG